MDAICVVPFSTESLEPVLKKARDQGIVVITHEAPGMTNADYDICLGGDTHSCYCNWADWKQEERAGVMRGRRSAPGLPRSLPGKPGTDLVHPGGSSGWSFHF